MRTVSRRVFLRLAAALGAGAAAVRCSPATPRAPNATLSAPTPSPSPLPSQPPEALPITPPTLLPASPAPVPSPAPTVTSAGPNAGSAYLAVVRGPDPVALTERAIAAVGGIERFVRSGYDVIIKPNICNSSRTFEYASTTNPDVVATLVRLCLGAGAKRVRVMDYPFGGTPQASYARSGIEEAVRNAGGEMEVMAMMGFVDTAIPEGVDLKTWPVYQPILDADLVINVPIAKHHSLARLTLGGKNLMGTVNDRGQIHRNLGQRIADITSLVRPELTVVDAVRILMRNGPTGGNLDDVKLTNTLIASTDIVAADAYACSLFGVPPEEISYIAASAKMGLGTMDLSGVKVEEFAI